MEETTEFIKPRVFTEEFTSEKPTPTSQPVQSPVGQKQDDSTAVPPPKRNYVFIAGIIAATVIVVIFVCYAFYKYKFEKKPEQEDNEDKPKELTEKQKKILKAKEAKEKIKLKQEEKQNSVSQPVSQPVETGEENNLLVSDTNVNTGGGGLFGIIIMPGSEGDEEDDEDDEDTVEIKEIPMKKEKDKPSEDSPTEVPSETSSKESAEEIFNPPLYKETSSDEEN